MCVKVKVINSVIRPGQFNFKQDSFCVEKILIFGRRIFYFITYKTKSAFLNKCRYFNPILKLYKITALVNLYFP